MMVDEPSRKQWHTLPERFRQWAAAHPGSVLLQTAKFDDENFRSLLFARPLSELIAHSREEIEGVLQRIDEETAQGRYVAGFAFYECGEVLQGLPARQRNPEDVPFLHMGVFEAPVVFDHRDGTTSGELPEWNSVSEGAHAPPVQIGECGLQIGEGEYAAKVARVQEYLAAGHSYQVNFTDRVSGSFEGTAGDLYERLIAQQPVAYAVYLDCGDYQVLSLSPELFYRISGQHLAVKPMKGTWPRGLNLEGDERAAASLLHDEKNRAEHTTIVDLLRNDLGRVCSAGSVRVSRLMEVERYRTLLQMTSTIVGERDPACTQSQVFRALFPSGSITGAPKRRTMEIIRELESGPRGVYTGSIGWFGPNGEACFNVAIRTLLLRNGRFTMGVGGGITADSDAAAEYAECRLKASFLQKPQPEFHLIETMLAAYGEVALQDRHLRRLCDSAGYFGIDFDQDALRDALHAALRREDERELRVRLLLDQRGRVKVECFPLHAVEWKGRLVMAAERTDASDVWLHHKTSNRRVYEQAFAQARERGFDEVLFTNRDGFLTEGAISNIFVKIGGDVLTPPLEHGVLPGIERSRILHTMPQARAAGLTHADLRNADEIWVCSALRGVRAVTAITDAGGRTVWEKHSAAGSGFGIEQFGKAGVVGHTGEV